MMCRCDLIFNSFAQLFNKGFQYFFVYASGYQIAFYIWLYQKKTHDSKETPVQLFVAINGNISNILDDEATMYMIFYHINF